MNDTKTLGKFGMGLSETRMKYEKYLDLVSVGYLEAMEKYLLAVAMYLKKNHLEDGCSTLGLLLIVDINKWTRAFDKHLTRRMNSPHYKLYTRSGLTWRIIRWHMRKKYLSNTTLSEIMENAQECPVEMMSSEEERNKEYASV